MIDRHAVWKNPEVIQVVETHDDHEIIHTVRSPEHPGESYSQAEGEGWQGDIEDTPYTWDELMEWGSAAIRVEITENIPCSFHLHDPGDCWETVYTDGQKDLTIGYYQDGYGSLRPRGLLKYMPGTEASYEYLYSLLTGEITVPDFDGAEWYEFFDNLALHLIAHREGKLSPVWQFVAQNDANAPDPLERYEIVRLALEAQDPQNVYTDIHELARLLLAGTQAEMHPPKKCFLSHSPGWEGEYMFSASAQTKRIWGGERSGGIPQNERGQDSISDAVNEMARRFHQRLG